METKKKQPWQIVVGILSIIVIVVMWTAKGVNGTAATEDMLPLVVTSAAVSLAKIAGIAAVVLIGKWLAAKIKNKNAQNKLP